MSYPKAKNIITLCTVSCALLLTACTEVEQQSTQNEEAGLRAEATEWVALFNGKDLQGWIPKFAGEQAGVNYNNTFQVRDGKLVTSYEQYDTFGDRFGHLYYKTPFSHYRLRVEYRFVGQQASNAPEWAFENNGVMIHSQHPNTMSVEQGFPASVEMQFLSGTGRNGNERPTGNMCSTGSHIVLNGELDARHCINSTSGFLPANEWVQAEIEVLGNDKVTHFINGEKVFEYTQPQLDPNEAGDLIAQRGTAMLSGGYIAVQAESHPTEFRKIEIMVLPGNQEREF